MPGETFRASGRVVLVGRPNVGKSTLFNRLTGTRRAIVTPIPGTTRDVLARPVEWLQHVFMLVDTGGVVGASTDPMQEAVAARGRQAASEVDLVVFVVDAGDGKCLRGAPIRTSEGHASRRHGDFTSVS